jgi:hypothetical protein
MIDLRQRKGRSGRTPGMDSLCLMIAEAWACGTLSAEKLVDHKPGVKEKRTEPAIIQYAISRACQRKVVMDQSGDKHPDGNYLMLYSFQLLYYLMILLCSR